MILPTILEPCPICGDDAEFCPKQRKFVEAQKGPVASGPLLRGPAVKRRQTS